MVEPAYQELLAKDIPLGEKDGVKVKGKLIKLLDICEKLILITLILVLVIAGESMGIKSPVRTRTPTFYLDFELSPGSSHVQAIPSGWTTFAYTLEGITKFGGNQCNFPKEYPVLMTTFRFGQTGNQGASHGCL